MRQRPEDLHAELVAAFGHRAYPGDDGISYLGRSGAVSEDDEARAWLQGKSWRDLLAEGMGVEDRDLVNYLSPEAWLYYLPALATFALDLDHPAEMDEMLLIRLAWRPEEVAPYVGPEEHRALVHLLEYLSAAHEERGYASNLAQYALDSFWRDFRPELRNGGEPPPSNASQENGDVLP